MAPKRVLELFSGTGSIGRYCRAHGYDEVVSLDLDPKSNATHSCDILEFDYKQYPVGYFHYVHSSPPCTEYSVAKTSAPRDLEKADRIVVRTLEIIRYFQPVIFTLENPATGMLKNREFMKGIPYTVVDYCQFHTPEEPFLYRKRTAIWTNKVDTLAKPRPLCDGACAGIRANEPGQRAHAVGFGGRRSASRKMIVSNIATNLKHRIPQALIAWLLD